QRRSTVQAGGPWVFSTSAAWAGAAGRLGVRMAPEFDTSRVSIQNLPELGGAAAVANTAIQAGELVFYEKALVQAPAPTNLARVRAYCQLDLEQRRLLRETFWSEAPAVRCAATAACDAAEEDSGDSAAQAGCGWVWPFFRGENDETEVDIMALALTSVYSPARRVILLVGAQ
ncbi:unnamed protein product, partial [Effrenium voratum]